jgi:hypothetical protein
MERKEAQGTHSTTQTKTDSLNRFRWGDGILKYKETEETLNERFTWKDFWVIVLCAIAMVWLGGLL